MKVWWKYSWIMVLIACQPKKAEVKNVNYGPALGTSYSLVYFTESEVDYQQQIDSVFEVVNKSMSTYIPDSDISKINAGNTNIAVDHMFREVFELSSDIHKKSGGYFDPTVGTLVNAWGFGPGKQIQLDSARVDSLLDYVGFNKVSLGTDNQITKADAHIYFDFNAVAKGYAIDRLAVMLEEKGVENFLVEVGGEIVVKGRQIEKQKPWTVGIDDPQGFDRNHPKILLHLKEGQALASSGNYRKFRVDSVSGQKYVHTIDPKTGWTKNSNILGTSVIAPNCATADAYATTFMALDLADSKALVQSLSDIEAFIIYVDEAGNTQQFITEGFQRCIVN
ncbi:FAD:protein FMN transferase [Sediminicola luteus]|uniref:FAD:protein FMN transferase n=1 Tax=Sediminicola luteus TaxID=319238 RepID=A0A2A4G381_9FLAO|nr:FAD:protein FMN transferase [Sediminicola luteus]PCE63429.1 thiamine biosynthesis protein ApbE [Sediminicola luteus]